MHVIDRTFMSFQEKKIVQALVWKEHQNPGFGLHKIIHVHTGIT